MPQSFERETRAGCSRLRTFTPVTRLLLICLSFLCAGPLSAQPNVHMWKVLVDDRCAFPDFRLFRVAHPELLKPIGEPAFAARVPAPDALEQSFAPWERLRNYEQEAMEAHRENGMRRWQFITALDDLYGPDIRAVLRKEGLPESFGFLPLLLTGYDPSFVGEGDRAGLWAQSYIDARAAGLRVDADVDERMLPDRATRAAVSQIKQLRALFPGADHRVAVAFVKGVPYAQRWTGEPGADPALDAWIALFRVAVRMQYNLEHTSVRFAWMEFQATWKSIPCDAGSIRRPALEALLGMDRRNQRTFFPWWTGEGLDCQLLTSYPTRIPALFADRWATSWDTLVAWKPPAAPVASTVPAPMHTVRKGDMLGTIARKYGVSVAELKRWNGLRSDRLDVGDRLQVGPPRPQAPKPAAAPSSPASGARVHTVKPGETVYGIARLYPGVAPEALLKLNGLTGTIFPGQKLRIPDPPRP
jgi:membrane-bound lytic murein transglycosylase D